MPQTIEKPHKWWQAYRNDDEKCVFVGKDGKSGLIRARDKDGKHYDWRSTDALARESGLSKRRVEEILDHWCKKGVVRQHGKDPEKWGYWENVGQEKGDPDPVSKDHEDRVDKQLKNAGKPPAAGKPAKPALPGGNGKVTTPPPQQTPPPAKILPVPGIPPVRKKLPKAQPATPTAVGLNDGKWVNLEWTQVEWTEWSTLDNPYVPKG